MIPGINPKDLGNYADAYNRAGFFKRRQVNDLIRNASAHGSTPAEMAKALGKAGPKAIAPINIIGSDAVTAYAKLGERALKLVHATGDNYNAAALARYGERAARPMEMASNNGKNKEAVENAAVVILNHDVKGIKALESHHDSLKLILQHGGAHEPDIVEILSSMGRPGFMALRNHGVEAIDPLLRLRTPAAEVLSKTGGHRLDAIRQGGMQAINFGNELGEDAFHIVADHGRGVINLIKRLKPDAQADAVKAAHSHGEDFLALLNRHIRSGYGEHVAKAVASDGQAAINHITSFGREAAKAIAENPQRGRELLDLYGEDAALPMDRFGPDAGEFIFEKGRPAGTVLRHVMAFEPDERMARRTAADVIKRVRGARGDEILHLLNTPTAQESKAVLDAIRTHKDKAIDFMLDQGTSAAAVLLHPRAREMIPLMREHSNAADAFSRFTHDNGLLSDALDIAKKFGSRSLEVLANHEVHGLNAIKNHGMDALGLIERFHNIALPYGRAVAQTISERGQEGIDFINAHGEGGVRLLSMHGFERAKELIEEQRRQEEERRRQEEERRRQAEDRRRSAEEGARERAERRQRAAEEDERRRQARRGYAEEQEQERYTPDNFRGPVNATERKIHEQWLENADQLRQLGLHIMLGRSEAGPRNAVTTIADGIYFTKIHSPEELKFLRTAVRKAMVVYHPDRLENAERFGPDGKKEGQKLATYVFKRLNEVFTRLKNGGY